MSWERRQGQPRYYTRSQRVDGRIVRHYIGTGSLAELAATEDALARVQRQIEAKTEQAAQQRYEELTPLDELCQLTDVLLKATLVSAGYHQHNRGAWRRRKHVPTRNDKPQDLFAGASPAAGEGR